MQAVKEYQSDTELVSSVIINHIKQCITDTCGNIASALSSSGYNIRYVCLHDQFLGLDHIYKAYRHTDDQLRIQLAILNQFIETYQRSGGIPMAKISFFPMAAALSMLAVALVVPLALAVAATSSSEIKQNTSPP